MVGYDERDVAVEVPAPPSMEEISQAVVLLADQHHDLAPLLRVVHVPVEVELPGHVGEAPGKLLGTEREAVG